MKAKVHAQNPRCEEGDSGDVWVQQGKSAAGGGVGTGESRLACTALQLPLKRSEALVFEPQKDLAGDGNSGRGLIRLLSPTYSLYKTRSGISFWCTGCGKGMGTADLPRATENYS